MKTLLFQESLSFTLGLTFIFIIIIIITRKLKYIILYFIILILLMFMYRSPTPNISYLTNFIYSPSSGTIREIQEQDDSYYISTFLSPANVHVQYTPYPGRITKITHTPGKLTPAFLKKSKYNERVETLLETNIGVIKIYQIAGVIFHHIVTFIKLNSQVNTGDKLGMIKTGSRVDIIISKNKTKLLVKKGDKVKGGVTPLAEVIK